MTASPDRLHVLPTAEHLARSAASWIVERLDAACGERGRASLALSGGGTPARTFETLAGPGFADWPRWQDVTCYWVDERAVGPEDPASNFGLAKRLLFDHLPRAPRLHRLRGEAGDLESEARRYAGLLAQEEGSATGEGPPSLDVVLLGLGEDGHVASLFPGDTSALAAESWVTVTTAPPPHRRRLTLTGPILEAARSVAYLVAGRGKRDVLRRVLAERRQPEEVGNSPAARVRRQRATDWFVDAEAAPGGES